MAQEVNNAGIMFSRPELKQLVKIATRMGREPRFTAEEVASLAPGVAKKMMQHGRAVYDGEFDILQELDLYAAMKDPQAIQSAAKVREIMGE